MSYRGAAATSIVATGLLVGLTVIPGAAQTNHHKLTDSHTVQIAQAPAGEMQRQVELPVTVESYERAEIMSYVRGHVGQVHVDIGDEVKKDTVLVTLHVPEIKAEWRRRLKLLAKAKADLASRQSEVERERAKGAQLEAAKKLYQTRLEHMSNLVQSKAVKKVKLDEAQYAYESALAASESNNAEIRAAEAQVISAEAAVHVAEAERDKAQALMSYLEIKAPFDGVISERNVDTGDYVRPPTGGNMPIPLFAIENVQRLRAIVNVPIQHARQVDVGDPIQFRTIRGLPEQMLRHIRAPGGKKELTISRYAKAAHNVSRMMRVEIDLDNPVIPETGKRLLQPGDYGMITAHLSEENRTEKAGTTRVRKQHSRVVSMRPAANHPHSPRRDWQPLSYVDFAVADDRLHREERVVIYRLDLVQDGSQLQNLC